MSILKVSIRQVKAARSLLAWSQEQLAKAADVSIPTIKRLESDDGDLGGRTDTAAKIVGALEAAGVDFIGESDGGAGVRLRALAVGDRVRFRAGSFTGQLPQYRGQVGEVVHVGNYPGQGPRVTVLFPTEPAEGFVPSEFERA